MTAQKHTPGEWKYGVRKDGSMWLSIGNPETGPHYQGDLVASQADARLIAAAPELLEALSALDRMSRGVDWCDQDEQARRWAVARAAIAKAEGRS